MSGRLSPLIDSLFRWQTSTDTNVHLGPPILSLAPDDFVAIASRVFKAFPFGNRHIAANVSDHPCFLQDAGGHADSTSESRAFGISVIACTASCLQ
jgi:hypothetical protein